MAQLLLTLAFKFHSTMLLINIHAANIQVMFDPRVYGVCKHKNIKLDSAMLLINIHAVNIQVMLDP